MIICPQCNHQNSDDSEQCEACLSELPQESSCPNCGFNNLESAKFCGICGYLLAPVNPFAEESERSKVLGMPEPDPPEPVLELSSYNTPFNQGNVATLENPAVASTQNIQYRNHQSDDTKDISVEKEIDSKSQQKSGILIHQATQFQFYLNREKSPIYIGKPNRKIMPDINLATLKNSEVVSRIHAKILINDNVFYIQDDGSANGTFVNHQRIPSGEKRLLKSGDEISLGKGNLVAFTFELS